MATSFETALGCWSRLEDHLKYGDKEGYWTVYNQLPKGLVLNTYSICVNDLIKLAFDSLDTDILRSLLKIRGTGDYLNYSMLEPYEYDECPLLSRAIENGSIDIIDLALVEFKCFPSHSIIRPACKKGQIDIVYKLLTEPSWGIVDPNSPCPSYIRFRGVGTGYPVEHTLYSGRPLHYVAASKSRNAAAILDLLIVHGADPLLPAGRREDFMPLPIHVAAWLNNLEIVDKLLNYAGDSQLWVGRPAYGYVWIPLQFAIHAQHLEMVRLLMEHPMVKDWGFAKSVLYAAHPLCDTTDKAIVDYLNPRFRALGLVDDTTFVTDLSD